MGLRYDTVMEMHVRVRRQLEQLASDPQNADPAATIRTIEAIIKDEFASLQVHAATMSSRDVVGVLGDGGRVLVYTELLTLRAVAMATAGDTDGAARQAQRVLEIHIEHALEAGALEVEADGIATLRTLMGERTLSETHAEALAVLRGERYR